MKKSVIINLILLDSKLMVWSRGPCGQGPSLAFTAVDSALRMIGHQLPKRTDVGLDAAQAFFHTGPQALRHPPPTPYFDLSLNPTTFPRLSRLPPTGRPSS